MNGIKNIILTRPLVFLDLETTSADPAQARIVEIATITVAFPEAEEDSMTIRLNPKIPIPGEATAIHGIADRDVADCPTFATVAPSLLKHLKGCDLAGYNLKRFDLKVLCREFSRAGLEFDLTGRHIIDAMEIFHRNERRDLFAAVKFYLGKQHEGAHGALQDATATAEVLDAQVYWYGLPATVAELASTCREPGEIDIDGCFVRVGEDVVFAFGKYKGKSLAHLANFDRGYLQWMLKSDFLPDTKRLVDDALNVVYAEESEKSACVEPFPLEF